MAGNSARTAALAALLTLAAGCVVEEAARTAVGNVKGLLDLDKRSEKEALAKEGDLDAHFALGQSYCCGAGGFLSTRKALKWYCTAARKGHLESQIEVSKIHAGEYAWRTPGLRPDRALALMWLEHALSSGRIFADPYQKRLMAKVSPGGVTRAAGMRKNWRSARCEI